MLVLGRRLNEHIDLLADSRLAQCAALAAALSADVNVGSRQVLEELAELIEDLRHDQIRITVVRPGSNVRLGVTAPKHVPVLRSELS